MSEAARSSLVPLARREIDADERSGTAQLRDRWPLQWSDLGLFVVAYAVITALFVGAGKLIVNQFDDSVGAFDRRMADRLVEGRTARLDDLSFWGSMLSETFVKVAFTAVVITLMVAVWRRWEDALLVASTLILEASIFLTVTLLVRRARPDVPRLDGSPVDSSFPSGHVAAAVVYGAFAIVVWRHVAKPFVTWLAVMVVVAISLAVAWSRTYRGMHYVSDVVAGVVLGLVSLAAAWWIINRAVNRHEMEEEPDVQLEATEGGGRRP